MTEVVIPDSRLVIPDLIGNLKSKKSAKFFQKSFALLFFVPIFAVPNEREH